MSLPRPRRSVAAVALATVCLLLLPGIVLGHAELATMTPADKSTVPPPTEIVATFTENLDPSGSNLAVVDSGGKVLAQGGTVDATDKKQMTLDLSTTPLSPGSYTIRWTSKSADDGDLDRNTTTFTVIAATPVPSVAPSATPPASGSASASVAPPSSAAPSPSPSGGTGTTTSSTDALIPIVIVLIAVVALGAWLLRGRGRSA
jgi:methionine-rich copper-binding protein CopC